MFQTFWLALFFVWKIEDIGNLGMLPICGWHKGYLKFVDIDDKANFSVGDEKASINCLIDQHLVFRTLIFANLKFFEKWHFFHKKWLINIYSTFQNHNSLRKNDSSYVFTIWQICARESLKSVVMLQLGIPTCLPA